MQNTHGFGVFRTVAQQSPIILSKPSVGGLSALSQLIKLARDAVQLSKHSSMGSVFDLSGKSRWSALVQPTITHRLCRMCQLETVGPALVNQQECQSRQFMQVISSRVFGLVSFLASRHPTFTRSCLPVPLESSHV